MRVGILVRIVFNMTTRDDSVTVALRPEPRTRINGCQVQTAVQVPAFGERLIGFDAVGLPIIERFADGTRTEWE